MATHAAADRAMLAAGRDKIRGTGRVLNGSDPETKKSNYDCS
ncbi:hypothetical protein BN2497_3357 [Janthinobacterium sp. CG23_2]|nr:hypothetical protein BN2497_3357 [Janthinobacterium sp. CG23_2]CUU28076.1 hypothetical protein BN3177_3357 [Janthinobacterium sp. CG23_2]